MLAAEQRRPRVKLNRRTNKGTWNTRQQQISCARKVIASRAGTRHHAAIDGTRAADGDLDVLAMQLKDVFVVHKDDDDDAADGGGGANGGKLTIENDE